MVEWIVTRTAYTHTLLYGEWPPLPLDGRWTMGQMEVQFDPLRPHRHNGLQSHRPNFYSGSSVQFSLLSQFGVQVRFSGFKLCEWRVGGGASALLLILDLIGFSENFVAHRFAEDRGGRMTSFCFWWCCYGVKSCPLHECDWFVSCRFARHLMHSFTVMCVPASAFIDVENIRFMAFDAKWNLCTTIERSQFWQCIQG